MLLCEDGHWSRRQDDSTMLRFYPPTTGTTIPSSTSTTLLLFHLCISLDIAMGVRRGEGPAIGFSVG